MDQQQPTISIQNSPQGQTADHDLLLTIKAEMGTKLDRVISDVRDLKNDTVARIAALENEKLDQSVFDTYRAQVNKDFEDYKSVTDKCIQANTKQIEYLLKWLYYGFGGIGFCEALLVLIQVYKSLHH